MSFYAISQALRYFSRARDRFFQRIKRRSALGFALSLRRKWLRENHARKPSETSLEKHQVALSFLHIILFVGLCGGCQRSFENPPLRVFPDMDDQKKVKPQSKFSFFEGGQSLQYPIEGTVARNDLDFTKNKNVDYGKFLYSSYCLPCHGITGEGYGPVSKREIAALLRPPSLKDGITRTWSDEQIHQLITQGRGRMGSYAHLINSEDRWAVVGYIRQLQKKGGAK
ncbi:MAG: cytochrome c [Deltaproteobacteria bacterium]|nr:cytochrome c [Deltaproteobacteria bacterium]